MNHRKLMKSFREDFESGSADETTATIFYQLVEYADALESEAAASSQIPPKIDPEKEPHLVELRRLADAGERIAAALEMANKFTAHAKEPAVLAELIGEAVKRGLPLPSAWLKGDG